MCITELPSSLCFMVYEVTLQSQAVYTWLHFVSCPLHLSQCEHWKHLGESQVANCFTSHTEASPTNQDSLTVGSFTPGVL